MLVGSVSGTSSISAWGSNSGSSCGSGFPLLAVGCAGGRLALAQPLWRLGSSRRTDTTSFMAAAACATLAVATCDGSSGGADNADIGPASIVCGLAVAGAVENWSSNSTTSQLRLSRGGEDVGVVRALAWTSLGPLVCGANKENS